MLTPRQELLLGKVVDGFSAAGQPVGSKALAADPDVDCGPSTIRNELAVLEELGLLAHPHTSAGRVPTDAGYRYFVDRVLPARRSTALEPRPPLALSLVRREVDEAMRVTTETLSQVTNLLAIVTAPPLETTTIRHVEVLRLQPQVLMVVIITSTGGVSKRVFTFDRPIDPGLAEWAAEYLNEQLVGMGLGARMLHSRLADPTLHPTERAFVAELAPAFTDLAVDGRGHAVRRRRRPAAVGVPLPGPLAAQRADGDARAPRVAAQRALGGAGRARPLRPHRRPRTRSRRCARCRWSPPTTACRSATSAPCR